jgi:D-amino-acid dehydrogenase
VVVGAGVIGLATAFHLLKDGARVTVVDRDPEGDRTSFGNAGGIAVTEMVPASAPGTMWRVFGWMIDPLGPLAIRPAYVPKLIPWLTRFARVGTAAGMKKVSAALAALNNRAYEDLLPMLRETALSAELHRDGALSLYESVEGYRRDADEWECKRAHGVVTQEMTGDEARNMEPALGPLVYRAVFTPQWSTVSDPKRLVQALQRFLADAGVTMRRGEVSNLAPGASSNIVVQTLDETMDADCAVLAAGAWSGALARRIGDPVLLESERGYNMTLPEPGVRVTRQLIFPERKFVATPLSCGLRIGGAVEFGGLEAAPNFRRSAALVELARRYMPQLLTAGGTSWAGHRPATPDSLPVIGRSHRNPNVYYAFGHGHLGLTQAATTGRLVSDLVIRGAAPIDLSPYDIARFAKA